MRERLLTLCALLLSGLLSCFVSSDAVALTPEQGARFERELRVILKLNPRYVWGGSKDEKSGLDCSGAIFLAASRAGFPVSRTTAYNMALGLAGWRGTDIVELRDAEDRDLVFWTWRDKPTVRKHGHVGAILVGSDSLLLEVAHASERRGFVVVPLFRASEVSKIRRLSVTGAGPVVSGK